MGKKSNWDIVNGQKFGDDAATRDVQGQQVLQRGEKGEISNPWPRRIISVVVAVMAGFVGYIASFIVAIGLQGFAFITLVAEAESALSFIDFVPDYHAINTDWRVWAIAIVSAILSGLIMYERMMAGWRSENSMADTTDINPHKSDQHITLIEELQRELEWFPDAGAHAGIEMTSMLSHVMVSNKGIKTTRMAKRYTKDGEDDDGNDVFKGQIMKDSDGNTLFTTEPFFDEAFTQELFTASGIPKKAKDIRIPYDVRKIPYNPPIEGDERKKKPDRISRDKQPYTTVGEYINADWDIPEYEVQRPAGAFLVDTAPANTMVLAITRAGKGQTVIEPTIDMWTREKRKNNIVVNDPKGELLVKFFVPATVRGYEVIQFNLMVIMKTNVYNPVGFAANFAREGDYTKAASYIENIGDVFFPKEGADDPMWPNAANNAFKRTVFGLIDYYLEEEKQLRRNADVSGMSEKVLAQQLDDMWGKVTLYNAYQLFVILSSKKSSDEAKIKIDDDEEVKEKDYLTLFFDATAKLPNNAMRDLVANTDRSLRAMAGSDKTIASCELLSIEKMGYMLNFG